MSDAGIRHDNVLQLNDRSASLTLHGRQITNDGVPGLVRAIQSNRTIRRAFVEERFLETLTTEELSCVCKALAHRPHLESIKCSGLKDRSFCALVGAIRSCPHPPPLTRMWVIGLTLTDVSSKSALSLLLEALSNMPTLQTVNLLLIAPEETEVESSVNLEFCNSEGILWEVGVYDQYISIVLLTSFEYNRDRWTNLKVSGVDSSGAAARAVSHLLSSSEPIALDRVQLSLDGMPLGGASHVATALARNHTLKELSLQLGGRDLLSISRSSLIMEPFVQMLETNTGLEWLQISRNLFHDETAVALARCLTLNQTLKVLDLTFDTATGRASITDKGYNGLWDMLQVNQVIEVIPCYGLDQDSVLKSKIELWLKLNETGIRRVQLAINTHYDEFLELLDAEGEDLNCVFYLLSKNPLLFSNMIS